MIINEENNQWRIFYRKNTGEDIVLEMPSLEYCLLEAKKLMTTLNYMICIEENGERIKRWDREIIANCNKWYICRPDDVEILGELITINKVIRK
ncbi:hypothetical protein A6J71_21720 [Enterobacter cancerogenus]|uniref:type IV pilus biogenesis protein PilI n=1 Tax=Enterobacter cancerogenus TaxID=69218 RepID=UPI000C9C131D|nr:hypothetical protein [Enterobacter cancerogenus]EIX9082242.1 hypothetical protein [Klebsiella aerogenes]PNF12613.1 hypothetical protein A6J71_21720 [Enterobacter cancerogenus]